MDSRFTLFLNYVFVSPFFLPGCGPIGTISSRRLFNESLFIAIHQISSTTGSTTGVLAPIALFCFTSSFKTTLFVRICIFYRSLSYMKQCDRLLYWHDLCQESKTCVQRERLSCSPLFILWTGLYWTTMYNQTAWKLSYCIHSFIMLQVCTYFLLGN